MGNTLTSVSQAFTFCALFITGMGLAKPAGGNPDSSGDGGLGGELPSHQRSVVITTLVMGKSILFAFLVRYATQLVTPESERKSGELGDLLNFIYLYGTLPVAAAPVVLAQQYGIRVGVVAEASVLSILFAMPLMCFSSILFMAPDVEELQSAVQLTSEASIITIWTVFLK